MTQYPEGLVPDHTEKIGSHVVPATTLEFEVWVGAPVTHTFGGKPIVNSNGVPAFAELALLHLAESAGWEGRWVEVYGGHSTSPRFLSAWLDQPYKLQVDNPMPGAAEEQTALLRKIAEKNGSFAGCWDLILWKGPDTLFVESKRSRRDRIQKTQEAWLDAALDIGIDPSTFLIAKWDFPIEHDARRTQNPLTPSMVARVLGVTPKQVRDILRTEFGTLPVDETRWQLTDVHLAAIRRQLTEDRTTSRPSPE